MRLLLTSSPPWSNRCTAWFLVNQIAHHFDLSFCLKFRLVSFWSGFLNQFDLMACITYSRRKFMVKAKPTYVGIKDSRSMFCLNIAAKHTELFNHSTETSRNVNRNCSDKLLAVSSILINCRWQYNKKENFCTICPSEFSRHCWQFFFYPSQTPQFDEPTWQFCEGNRSSLSGHAFFIQC